MQVRILSELPIKGDMMIVYENSENDRSYVLLSDNVTNDAQEQNGQTMCLYATADSSSQQLYVIPYDEFQAKFVEIDLDN